MTFLLCGALALAASALGADEPPSLLRNPGFEPASGGESPSGGQPAEPGQPAERGQPAGAQAAVPLAGWPPYEQGYAVDRAVRRSGEASIRCASAASGERRGAVAVVTLNQKESAPFLVTGWSRAECVGGFANNDYSIYVDLEHSDGAPLWGQTAPFSTGTHDWQSRRVLVIPSKPLRLARIHALFRHHAGTVWFDDFRAVQLSGDDLFDGQPVKPPELPAGARDGWFARDVAVGSEALALDAPAGRRSEAEEELHLRAGAVATSRGGTVLVRAVEDLDAWPRAVTLYYVERFEAEEPVWWNDVRHAVPAGGRGERSNLARVGVGATGSLSLYPFGCVAGRGAARMLGLAPLQGPRVARIGYHAGFRLLYVAADFALTGENAAWSDGKGHGKADLSVVRSDVDPDWGFRAAAARYRELFPEAFERRAKAEGIWIPFTDPSAVRGVEDFGIAYHEGDNSVASDDRLGILSFRYTEPMTWWMPMPREVPRTYGDALGMVERYASGKDEALRRWAQAVLVSGSMDPGGRFNVELQDAPWTNGAVWVLNPNPRLPHAPHQWTKARLSYTRDMADAAYGQAAKGAQDGEYLDSLEGWADVLDYRPESVRSSPAPPVFTPEDPRPVVPTWFSVYALAELMSEDLHRRGKLLMANATPWRLHVFAPLLDVLGTETNWLPGGAWRPDADEVFNLRRTLSYHKPYLLLQNTDFDRFGPAEVERYFQRSLFYGVYPSMFSADASSHTYWKEPRWYDRDRALFKRYIPVIQALSAAGWEPVTHARSSDPRVGVERFGARHFTVLNGSGDSVSATLSADGPRLWGPGVRSVRAIDLLSGKEVETAAEGGRIAVKLTLGPEEARALEIGPAPGPGGGG
ncbi:MAG: hypothetical protein HY721_31220 [Planctomycetes bacterium]|nr:hypothetical protein [Planctomycetota bacterium]